MKLNQKREAALPILGGALLMLFLGVVAVAISEADILLISGLAYLASGLFGFCGICLLPYAAWVAVKNTAHSAQAAVALRTLPDLAPEVSRVNASLFDPAAIARVQCDAPEIATGVLKILDNQGVVQEHLTYLDGIRTKATNIMGLATERYAKDRSTLEEQQLRLYRMAHQASVLAKKVEADFPILKADLQSVPRPKAVALPALPSVMTATTYAKSNRQMQRGTNQTLARAGMEGAKGHIGVAIAGVVIAAAANVIQFQKTVRGMHEAHGQIKSYAARAADDLAALGLAHTEIVNISHDVYMQSIELRELLLWADGERKANRLNATSALNDYAKQSLCKLASFAILARLNTARAV